MCKLQALYKIKFKKMALEKYIRDIQGFPKEGILFKDITPLLIDPNATKECLQILVDAKRQTNRQGNCVESWFLFGMLLAQELNVGFIPVRKPNKLPYETISASYDLEYGS
jgi:adenine phosphoribosyltransferase